MKTTTRRWLVRGTVLAVLLAAGGFLVAASGIVSIKASADHWAITRWILEFGKRRSVATHTLGRAAPELAEPWLVLKGAGHYEGGCSPCHGSPALRTPIIAAAMKPPPPSLSSRVESWDATELAYLVEHGIKFTGMPAWPARGRDDEVRAVVAFLLTMPELDATEYLRLVHGDAPPPPADVPLRELPGCAPQLVRTRCARCHGRDGLGRENAAFPRLAGQREGYLVAALAAYAAGTRHSGIMQPIAAGLSEADRRAIAAHYAGLPAARADDGEAVTDAAAIERGRQIAELGIPSRGVPSCVDCHGPGQARRNPAYPNLAGQFADYLVLQLELFQRGARGGSPFAHLMDHVAVHLRDDEMRAVAAYYASLSTGG